MRLAATSNTLPDRLGEGRFAADDFLREIQGLSAHFDVYRIDGADYRHRGLPEAPAPLPELRRRGAQAAGEAGYLDDFADLMDAPRPACIPPATAPCSTAWTAVHLTGVRQLADQADALRLVVLADRLYDRDIPVVASGVPAGRGLRRRHAARRLPEEVLPRDLAAGRAGPRGRRAAGWPER